MGESGKKAGIFTPEPEAEQIPILPQVFLWRGRGQIFIDNKAKIGNKNRRIKSARYIGSIGAN